MKVRRAELKDLSVIQRLNNQLFELELKNFDSYLTKEWPLSNEGKIYFENSINNDFVAVVEIDDEVVGYILGAVADIPYYSFNVAELCNMCVDSKYRNRGIGRMLYDYFVEYYKSVGINHFIVTASFKNDNAKAFYKKMGFEEANITFTKF